MKIVIRDQMQLSHQQKLFYSLYGELPVQNMCYRYYEARKAMFDQQEKEKIVGVAAKQIEKTFLSAFSKAIPHKLQINLAL